MMVDAVFQEVTPFAGEPAPASCWAPESLDLMFIGDTGKMLGLRGTRIGGLAYTAGIAEAVLAAAASLASQLPEHTLRVLAGILTDKRYQVHRKRLLTTLSLNHRTLRLELGGNLGLLAGEATSMALIDVSHTGLTGDEFAEALLKDERVATVPCSRFSAGARQPLDHLIRIALARPPEVIREAAQRMTALAKRLRPAPGRQTNPERPSVR